MKKVSKLVEKNIIAPYSLGYTYRKLSQSLGVSIRLVSKVLKENKIQARKKTSGARTKLSERKQKLLVRKFTEKIFLLASDGKKWIKEKYDIKISLETIRKILKKHGIKCYYKHKNPLLTPLHQKIG